MVTEATNIRFNTNRKKVKRFTRKQRHAALLVSTRAKRVAAKAALRAGQTRARRDTRKYEVFEGCDPERTEALAEGR